MSGGDELRPETWTALGPILANVSLRYLSIECGYYDEDVLEEAAALAIEEELLHCVRLNNCLESIFISVGGSRDQKFLSKLEEHCNRNVTVKSSNALMKGSSLSMLPHVLEALGDRSATE